MDTNTDKSIKTKLIRGDMLLDMSCTNIKYFSGFGQSPPSLVASIQTLGQACSCQTVIVLKPHQNIICDLMWVSDDDYKSVLARL